MPTHIWTDATDFEYCTFNNTEVSGNTIVLSGSEVSGSVISDIRDSTDRLENYGGIRSTSEVDLSSETTLYYRTGSTQEYDEDFWGVWQNTSSQSARTEYTISVYDDTVITDYDIATVGGVFLEEEKRAGADLVISARVGIARVGFAQVGNRASPITVDYSTSCIFEDNRIQLATVLPIEGDNIAVLYLPEDYIINNTDRYVQWKCELSGSVSPVISEINIDYRLDYRDNISEMFPSLYRRI